MGKNGGTRRREPELKIRTRGFRLELDRLPRLPVRWVVGALIGAPAAVRVITALHLMR